MKALEFETRLHSSDTIEISESYQGQFTADQAVRVIVLIDDKNNDKQDWQDTVTPHFFSGYGDSDSEYDTL